MNYFDLKEITVLKRVSVEDSGAALIIVIDLDKKEPRGRVQSVDSEVGICIVTEVVYNEFGEPVGKKNVEKKGNFLILYVPIYTSHEDVVKFSVLHGFSPWLENLEYFIEGTFVEPKKHEGNSITSFDRVVSYVKTPADTSCLDDKNPTID